MITLPTTAQLYESILADLESEFAASISEDGKGALRTLASMAAGKLRGYYLALGSIQKNMSTDTCDEETLLRKGYIKLNRYPFKAVAGKYVLLVTGDIGGVIPAQTTFKSDDDSLNPGVLYILDNAFVMTATTDSITVRCLTAGTDGKLDVGDTLTATAPIPLVDQEAEVASEFVQPLAGETIEEYREVVIESERLEPQGGAASDYRIWARDAQGVASVYPYAKAGEPCGVNIYVEATIADSSDGKGTPTQPILDAVEDVVEQDPDTSLPIDERGRRPLQVIAYFLPVAIREIEVTVDNFSGLTAAIETAISAAVVDAINAIRPFVAGADNLTDKNDILDGNKIIATILTARPGSSFGDVTFTVDGVPMSTFTFANGDIPYVVPAIIFT